MQTKTFPLSEEASQALREMKDKLAKASFYSLLMKVLHPIDEILSFTVETDASDFAISAT